MELINNIDDVISSIENDFTANSFVNMPNGLMLTNREISVLRRNNINISKCFTLKQILYEIEEVISDSDYVDEELDYVSSSIAERDYYQNTNK